VGGIPSVVQRVRGFLNIRFKEGGKWNPDLTVPLPSHNQNLTKDRQRHPRLGITLLPPPNRPSHRCSPIPPNPRRPLLLSNPRSLIPSLPQSLRHLPHPHPPPSPPRPSPRRIQPTYPILQTRRGRSVQVCSVQTSWTM
jgi:hypothetical protein